MWISQIPSSVLEKFAKIVGGAEQAKAFFQKGEIVQGRVLKSISPNKAFVKIGGMEIMASTESRLVTGQPILGKVEKVSPNITITLLETGGGKEEKATGLMRLLLPGKAPMGDALSKVLATVEKGEGTPKTKEALAKVEAVIKSVVSSDPGKITAEQTKTSIMKSGLYLESAIKEAIISKSPEALATLNTDLKGALGKALTLVEADISRLAKAVESKLGTGLMDAGKTTPTVQQVKPDIKAEIQTQGKAQNRSIASSMANTSAPLSKVANVEPEIIQLANLRESAHELKNVINNIELNQLINAGSKKEGTPAQTNFNLYQLPFFQGDTLDTARVYFRPKDEKEGSGKKGKKDASQIVFMLSMTKLGPVRVDVNVESKKVSGSIYVLNDSIAKHVKDQLPQLLAPLDVAGYEARFEVATAKRDYVTEQLETPSLISESGLINVQA